MNANFKEILTQKHKKQMNFAKMPVAKQEVRVSIPQSDSPFGFELRNPDLNCP
jgi:hypothetical protein